MQGLVGASRCLLASVRPGPTALLSEIGAPLALTRRMLDKVHKGAQLILLFSTVARANTRGHAKDLPQRVAKNAGESASAWPSPRLSLSRLVTPDTSAHPCHRL